MKKDGLNIEYHENGEKKSEGHYKDGKKFGKWTEWFDSGTIRGRGNYKNGVEDGKWTYYDEDGKKTKEIVYDVNRIPIYDIVEIITYHKDGSITKETPSTFMGDDGEGYDF